MLVVTGMLCSCNYLRVLLRINGTMNSSEHIARQVTTSVQHSIA
jgi:hypothetical protein